MRTTVRLNKGLLEQARREAARRGTTLTALVEQGLRIPAAWNAALAIEAGCEWITTDRDYTRFTGLKWRTPF